MLYSAAITRVIQNVGRGTAFLTDATTTSTFIDSLFNERQRQLCNDRNFWFMRTQTKYYCPKVNISTLYDLPIANTITGQLRYKSDLTMYIQQNTDKQLANFETLGATGENWTGVTADTTNFRTGTQGGKVSPTASTTANGTRPVKSDMTVFSDGSTSGTGDYIHAWVYLDSYINATSIAIAFDCNANDYATDYFEYVISTGLIDGWNEFRFAKSAFTRVGATVGKGWNTIVGMRVQATANANGTLNATFDEIQMIKASPNDNALALISRISEISSVQRYSSDDTGKPECYTLENGKFRLFPFADQSYTLWLIYHGYLTDNIYSSGTLTNTILTDYPEVLIKGVTADVFAYLGEYNDSQYWELEATKDFRDLLALDTVKKLSGEFMLVPLKDSGSGGNDYSSLPPATYI